MEVDVLKVNVIRRVVSTEKGVRGHGKGIEDVFNGGCTLLSTH